MHRLGKREDHPQGVPAPQPRHGLCPLLATHALGHAPIPDGWNASVRRARIGGDWASPGSARGPCALSLLDCDTAPGFRV